MVPSLLFSSLAEYKCVRTTDMFASFAHPTHAHPVCRTTGECATCGALATRYKAAVASGNEDDITKSKADVHQHSMFVRSQRLAYSVNKTAGRERSEISVGHVSTPIKEGCCPGFSLSNNAS